MDKARNMRIAANLCGFNFTDKAIDLLVGLYDLIEEKGGDTDLRDITKTETLVNEKHERIKRQEILDQISDKKA